MNKSGYVLITPVRNEEATIGITIESVARQTHPPKEWVIVSDQSTDRTDEIVREQAARHGFVRLMRLEKRPDRSFSSCVFAAEAGIAALQTRDYEFIGLLDADVRFGPRYFEDVLLKFAGNPKLGLAGGLVIDCYDGQRRRSVQSLGDVAGAVQFFRRQCFDSLGGLVAIPEGGWDTITCVRARMNGYQTQTFPDIEVDHLKPRNIAEGNIFRRFQQLGIREYALGNHPLFEAVKCAYRCLEYPFVVGGVMRFWGYLGCYLNGRGRMLPEDIVKRIRGEQLRRLFPFGRDSSGLAR
jgi:glycosyltransferase involved in cell wall biosynthesis